MYCLPLKGPGKRVYIHENATDIGGAGAERKEDQVENSTKLG